MNIAYVITRGDAVGGATVHVRDMARYLLDHGHQATILLGESSPANGEAIAELRRHHIPYVAIGSLRRAIDPFRDLAAVLELKQALRRIQPDLVSTHTAKAGILGRIAARACGIPAIFTPHGWAITDRISPTSGRVFRLAERWAAPMARSIVNVCEAERRLALQHRIAPAYKLAVIHNGVHDIAPCLRAEPAGEPTAQLTAQPAAQPTARSTAQSTAQPTAQPTAQSTRLIMVARFEAPKEHELVLAALAPLRDYAWQLEFVGSGPREQTIRALANDLGLGSRVHFSGHRNDTAGRLSQAQIFVLASRSEGFPRSILEAMRAGLPVVASDVGGIAEAVADGETGFVVPRGDTASLTQALASLILRPDLRHRLGRAGRQRYEQNFTFDQMAAKTMALYQQILNCETDRVAVAAGSF